MSRKPARSRFTAATGATSLVDWRGVAVIAATTPRVSPDEYGPARIAAEAREGGCGGNTGE
jgi:hypothetical protein